MSPPSPTTPSSSSSSASSSHSHHSITHPLGILPPCLTISFTQLMFSLIPLSHSSRRCLVHFLPLPRITSNHTTPHLSVVGRVLDEPGSNLRPRLYLVDRRQHQKVTRRAVLLELRDAEQLLHGRLPLPLPYHAKKNRRRKPIRTRGRTNVLQAVRPLTTRPPED